MPECHLDVFVRDESGSPKYVKTIKSPAPRFGSNKYDECAGIVSFPKIISWHLHG